MITGRDYYWDALALEVLGTEFEMIQLISNQYSGSPTFDPLTQTYSSVYDYIIVPKGTELATPRTETISTSNSIIKAPWE